MSDMNVIDDVFHVDWEQVRLKRALSGVVAMAVVLVFLGILGDPVVAAVLATLFVTAASGDGPMSQRLPGMMGFTVVGAALGGLAYWSTDSAIAVALVLALVTLGAALAASVGQVAARSGVFLTVWALMALILGSTETEPWTVAAGFLVGGAIAIMITAIRLRMLEQDDVDEGDSRDRQSETSDAGGSVVQRVVSATRSRVGAFALLLAAGVFVATVSGYRLFPDHPMWAAVTVMVVVKPSADQSLSVAVQRVIGTAVGVVIAFAVASVLPRSDAMVSVIFLACGALMIAFINANYALFAAFLTAMLVLGERLAQQDAFDAGSDRLLATALGAVIAVAVVGVASVLARLLNDNAPAT